MKKCIICSVEFKLPRSHFDATADEGPVGKWFIMAGLGQPFPCYTQGNRTDEKSFLGFLLTKLF